MPAFIKRISRFRPTLERQYEEVSRLYFWEDTQSNAIVRKQKGTYVTDLRKTVLCAVLGGVVLAGILRRR